MGENLIFHGVSVSLLIAIIFFLLKQYKMKVLGVDRVNKLWRDYCIKHKLPYTPLDGEKETMEGLDI